MQAKMFSRVSTMTLFAALAMPVWMAAQSQQQTSQKLPRYTITDLGTLGGTFGAAQGISNNGLVEGYATLPGDQSYHSFVWAGGVKIDLGTLGGSITAAATMEGISVPTRGAKFLALVKPPFSIPGELVVIARSRVSRSFGKTA